MKKDTDSPPATGKSPPSPQNGEVVHPPETHSLQNEDTGLTEKDQSAFNRIMGDIKNQSKDMTSVPSAGSDSGTNSPNADPDYDIETLLSQMEECDDADGAEAPSPPKTKETPASADTPPLPDENPADSRTTGEDGLETDSGADSPKASPKNKKILIAALVAAVLMALSFTGYRLWIRKPPAAPIAVNHPDTAGEPGSLSPAASPAAKRIPIQSPQGSPSSSGMTDSKARLAAIASELDQLRNEMIAKQQEIEDLRKYYQAGIDTEIKSILDIIRHSGKSTLSLQDALGDVHIRLGLAAIQRRDTYIRQLDVPAKALERDSEELLYLIRKAAALSPMADHTKDMDFTLFIRNVEVALHSHRHNLEQIHMDADGVSPRPLESIWPSVARLMPLGGTGPVSENQPARSGNRNAPIWNAICAGDFSHIDQLTELTPEAAQCLSRWEGTDLFLNTVSTLSPETARELVKWQGHWLGLNGLKKLSPESAGHLAQWNGKILSLNGLSQISPQVVAALSEWRGEEIELVGVTHMPNWPHTRIRIFFPEARKPQPPVSRK
ncbi:hypothetical protein LJC22_04400 [Desulfosarcina sp. OttesenSCG-928-G10]|nr:hypothetical protein [Desulfosarcina sp. OttesenSCG-928-G10]